MRALASALLALATLPALAQTAPPKVLNALLEDTQIRSGTASQFEAAQRDYCAAVVKGGAPACLVFSTATFGESNRYFTLLPFASFIHYDQGKYTDKGLTPDEAKALSARRSPPVASNHESAIALHADISILPTVTNADYPINYFTEYQLTTGSASAFLEILRKYVIPAAHKANAMEFEVFTTTVGGSPDTVLVATRLKNFAQLDDSDPIQAAMSATQRLSFRNAYLSYVKHTETWIMRYRADLSTDPRSSTGQ